MESFEHMGYWWLPIEPSEPISRKPETAIPGKLSFDPSTGGVLELLGILDTEIPYDFNEWKNYEIIHGLVKGPNTCVTLQGCYVQSISPNPHIFNETKLIVSCIYMGRAYLFDSIEDIVFENLSVGYTYLDDWMFQKNIETDMSFSDQEGLKSYSAKYTEPDPIEILLDDVKIKISPRFGGNSSISEVSIRNEYCLSITPNQPMHFDKYFKFINFHLPNFLTLATGHTNFPVNVSGLISEDHRITPWPMLFSFEDVKGDLPIYLSNWIRKSESMQATYELFFKEKYRKIVVLDSEFLNLAQALEAYHTNVYGGVYLTKEEYEPVKAALIDAIPNFIETSHQDALKGRIEFGNQYSLRTRLNKVFTEVLSEHCDDLQKLVGNPRDFIHRLVETRNYFTHRDGDPNESVLDDDELYEYCRKVRMLLRICFLKEMEFPPSEITRLLNNNQEYQFLTEEKSA